MDVVVHSLKASVQSFAGQFFLAWDTISRSNRRMVEMLEVVDSEFAETEE